MAQFTGGRVAVEEAGARVAQDPGLARAHAKLVADKTIQFDLPAFQMPKPPAWLKPLAEFFEQLAPYAKYIFWGAAAIVAGLILWFIIREMRGMSFRWPWQKKPEAEDEAEWQPDASAAQILLSEAEALAAQGRYAEAARLLLRRSVTDIAQRRPEFLRPSLTARDIARADAIPAGARNAFGAIARVVEVSAFGSAAVTAEAWAQCRQAYGQFALAGAWRG
jgi:hypothetical protein